MIETIIGIIIGAIFSLVITHFYYRRSGNELHDELDMLRAELETLKDVSSELKAGTDYIQKNVELTKKHVVRGTYDDPEYPYK